MSTPPFHPGSRGDLLKRGGRSRGGSRAAGGWRWGPLLLLLAACDASGPEVVNSDNIDEQIEGDKIIEAGACDPTCDQDSDKPYCVDSVCVECIESICTAIGTTKACVNHQWQDEDDCGNSAPFCVAGECKETLESDIGGRCAVEGQRACVAGNSRLTLVCRDGNWDQDDSCPTLERCTAYGEAAGTCVAVLNACDGKERGELVCGDDGVRYECGPDTATYEAKPCSGDTVCHAGDCIDCTPGQTRCSTDGSREVCSADTGAFEPMPCGASEPACYGGDCFECDRDDASVSCHGDALRSCGADGSHEDAACGGLTPVCA